LKQLKMFIVDTLSKTSRRRDDAALDDAYVDARETKREVES